LICSRPFEPQTLEQFFEQEQCALMERQRQQQQELMRRQEEHRAAWMFLCKQEENRKHQVARLREEIEDLGETLARERLEFRDLEAKFRAVEKQRDDWQDYYLKGGELAQAERFACFDASFDD
jgi:chromosome segregation ATPase